MRKSETDIKAKSRRGKERYRERKKEREKDRNILSENILGCESVRRDD